jgi:tetratricopeptide (TPR) repeat protein
MARSVKAPVGRKEGTLTTMFRRRITVGLVTGLLSIMAAASSTAADSARGEAKEEMKYGLNAAKRGYWLEALSRYERANELVPGQVNVLNNIAVALEAAGRFEEALVTYEIAVEIAPNDRVLRRNFSQFKQFYDEYVSPSPPDEEEESGEQEESTAPAEEQTGDDQEDS